MAITDKKILVAQVKRGDGVKLIQRLTNDSELRDLQYTVECELDGSQAVSVKFFYRGKKWVDSLPEAD